MWYNHNCEVDDPTTQKVYVRSQSYEGTHAEVSRPSAKLAGAASSNPNPNRIRAALVQAFNDQSVNRLPQLP